MSSPTPPTEIDPYKTLSLSPSASSDEVKSAYRKAALKWHPDKASRSDPGAKETAHKKFQEIAFAYAILSDEGRRKRYDMTGRTDDALYDDENGEGGGPFDWLSFYRAQFAEVVTLAGIQAFSQEYKGSEEERQAVLEHYGRAKGNMDKVYDNVMLSDPITDDERFRKLIRDAIEEGEVEAFEQFTEETQKSILRRIRRAEEQAKEAEEHAEFLASEKAKVEEERGDAREKRKRAIKETAEDGEENSAEDSDGGGSEKVKAKTSKKAKAAKRSTKADDGLAGLAAIIQQRQAERARQFDIDMDALDGAGPSEEAFAANRRKGKTQGTTDKENVDSNGVRKRSKRAS